LRTVSSGLVIWCSWNLAKRHVTTGVSGKHY
jgi:hypothetical protein